MSLPAVHVTAGGRTRAIEGAVAQTRRHPSGDFAPTQIADHRLALEAAGLCRGRTDALRPDHRGRQALARPARLLGRAHAASLVGRRYARLARIDGGFGLRRGPVTASSSQRDEARAERGGNSCVPPSCWRAAHVGHPPEVTNRRHKKDTMLHRCAAPYARHTCGNSPPLRSRPPSFVGGDSRARGT
jgi:hypothetical protein